MKSPFAATDATLAVANRSDNCLEKRLCHRTATRFGLIVAVALLAVVKGVAQQAPSYAGPRLQPNAGGEAAVVKRVVDGIMQPYLAQGQRKLPRGPTWSRSPNLGAIVAVSLHGHRYFFPYGKATNARVCFWLHAGRVGSPARACSRTAG